MPAPPRTRDVRKGLHVNYLRKAEGFARSAEAAASRGDFDAAVSAAVHAAITLVDALTTFYSGNATPGRATRARWPSSDGFPWRRRFSNVARAT